MKFLKKDTHIDFIGKKKFAFILSISVIILGLAIFGWRGKENFGIDFTGGLLQQLEFEKEIQTEDIRKALQTVGLQNSPIQQLTDNKKVFIIKTAFDTKDQVINAITENIPLSFEVLREEMVGPAVGKDLSKQGLLAILFSLIGILIYISWRFEFKFALGAVVALFHDVLITVGVLSLTGREITLPVLAALLTIVGYSLNDTIVVFDRIREFIKEFRRDSLPEIINKSINKTLSRTILTSVTTLFVVAFLYLFGGEVIHDFAFALLIGILVGTYSSIFIASPVLLFWEKTKPKFS